MDSWSLSSSSSSDDDGNVSDVDMAESNDDDSDGDDESNHDDDSGCDESNRDDDEIRSVDSYEEIKSDSEFNVSFQRNIGEKQKRKSRLSEHDKAVICLSDDCINSLIVKCACCKTRKAEKCKNDYKCANSLGGILEAKQLIKQFRKRLWANSLTNKPNSIAQRTLALLTDLQALLLEDETSSMIDYKVNGHRVCKGFYFEASGFTERTLNDAVAYVLGYRTSVEIAKFLSKEIVRGTKFYMPKKIVKHCSPESAEHVVKFLNHYFTYSVEWSPNGN